MSLSTNIATYGDVRAVLDRAIKLGGASVNLPTPGKAIHFRHRCRQFSKLYRQHLTARGENDGAQPTPYDDLMLEIEPGSCDVRILLRTMEFEVRSLDGTISEKVTSPVEEPAPRRQPPAEIPLTPDEQALVEAVKGLSLRVAK